MGIKLLVLLGLLIGVLYCFHILAQDYQAITAPKLLKYIFKRETNTTDRHRATVRWREILKHDAWQCVRFLYCELGARDARDFLTTGYIYLLTLNTKEEDAPSLEVFKEAYVQGIKFRGQLKSCSDKYKMCPFNISLLLDLLRYISLNKI